ncbi:hypothetical protein [Pseudonocardia alni]|uniref:hypothetical protein n=1 Tax=Pseudonocardia alni TaxID=33907 RepID=UPI00332A4527
MARAEQVRRRATPSRADRTEPTVVAAVRGELSIDAAVDEATRRDARLVLLGPRDTPVPLFAAGACVLVVGHRGGGRSPAAPLVRLARTVSCPLLIIPDT